MSKVLVMDAVAACRDVHQEAWLKLGKVIARKNAEGRSANKENSLRARANRRITDCNQRLIELEAATAVVAAPTPEEVHRVRQLIGTVRNLAVVDAMLTAGLKLITDAMADAARVAKAGG